MAPPEIGSAPGMVEVELLICPFQKAHRILSLVGGLEHFLFSHIFRIIIPTDEVIFFRGVALKPPTRHLHILRKSWMWNLALDDDLATKGIGWPIFEVESMKQYWYTQEWCSDPCKFVHLVILNCLSSENIRCCLYANHLQTGCPFHHWQALPLCCLVF